MLADTIYGPTQYSFSTATMNILLYTDEDCRNTNEIVVSDHRLDNLRQVQNAQPGDVLKVGKINGAMGTGILLTIDANVARLKVTLDRAPPEKLPLVLVVALPRPKMLRRILRAVAEFGVEELHLINSYRVQKSFWQTPVLEPSNVQHFLLQGLEQSRDTVMPAVICHRRFKPFVEDEFPEIARNRRALVAHPGPYPPCPRGLGDTPGLVVIGPEGGLIEYEVDKLQQAGCKAVSLGSRILRVENAVTALVARLY